MSSKKILAASLAAILAVGSVSAMAFADETPAASTAWPANDEFNWTISGKDAGDASTYTLKLDATMDNTTAKIKAVYGNDNYAAEHLAVGLWEAFGDFNITDVKNASVDASFKVVYNYEAPLYVTDVKKTDQYISSSEYGMVPALKLSDGTVIYPRIDIVPAEETTPTTGTVAFKDWIKIEDGKQVVVTGTEITNITDQITMPTAGDFDGSADGKEAADVKGYVKALADELWTVKSEGAGKSGLATKEKEVKATVALDSVWKDASAYPGGSTTAGSWTAVAYGKTYGPVMLNTNLGLASGERVANPYDTQTNQGDKQDIKELKYNVKAEITVDRDTYAKYVEKTYSINGGNNYNWITGGWSNTANVFEVDNGALANTWGLALVANSRGDDGGNWGADYVYGAAIPDSLTAEPTKNEATKDLFIKRLAATGINFAEIVPPNVMKNLNNGGTITFYFDKTMDWSAYVTGVLQYWNSNNRIVLNAQSGYSLTDDKITFEIPAGLSWDDALNAYKPFNLDWDFRNNVQAENGTSIWIGENPSVNPYDGNIVAISFKANGAAASDDNSTSNDSNNGGDNSGNNGGNNGGNSGNPNTGIALAVAPVVLAAGAVATVVAKKRK